MIKRLYHAWKNWVHHWHGEIIFLVELFKHPDIPRSAKVLIFTLLSYIFSPIDLIPDFIPIFGHWDDFMAIPIVLKIVERITPKEIIDLVRANIAADPTISLFRGKGPKIAAVSILFIWVGISWLIMRALGIEGI